MALNLYEMDPKIYDDYINTEIEKVNFDKVFELIKEIHDKKGKIEIPDFCCGTGIFPRKWLTKLNNINYIGVDINKNFIKFAKEKLSNKRFSFILEDAISFKNEKKFDLILATSSYHHIEDDKK